MSDNGEFSVWSNDETDLLEYIDKESKLVSSGSEPESQQVNQSNGEVWKVLQKNEAEKKNVQIRQSGVDNTHMENLVNQNSNIIADKAKTHFSSNDLSKEPEEGALQGETVPNNVTPFSHSHSCNSLSNNDRNLSAQRKYNHVQSKIKQYFLVRSSSEERKWEERSKGEEYVEVTRDYLEEVNKSLMLELEEKNALLSKLQENYENLLLKYAEAQNKIDQLRLKSVCDSPECQLKQNLPRNNLQLPLSVFSTAKQHQEAWEDGKCQKAVVAPFMKDSYQDKPEARKADRPTSLPLEPKAMERDAIKAGTPTDSEGVSSVITSMSGHSKILNTLDVHSPSMESKLVSYPERDFLLNDSSVVNDAFDKVKNWQNSLPPLELIETPETTLYDESPVRGSPSTNYLMPPSPKDVDEEADEVVFPSPRTPDSYEGVKEFHRGTTRKKNHLLAKHPQQMSIPEENGPNSNPSEDISSGCIIQRRRKKPPLLRCSSLPAYHCDSPRSASRNVYIPPLDLENLTLSDVDSSQVEYEDYSKANRGTSSSYITSRSGSMEFSSQTYRTMNQSFKGRASEYTDSPYSKPCFNKSTSISPERCNDSAAVPPLARTKPDGTCLVCGEKLQSLQSFPCRSNSYQSFNDVNEGTTPKTSSRKYPFNRSVSFNSETNSHRRCFHSHNLQQRSSDSLDAFDAYASNLKARSQVTMKALAAHVNNT